MKLFYRLSDGGYNKEKPSYINNKNCLENFISVFNRDDITIIADNVSDKTYEWLKSLNLNINRTNFGKGSLSFGYAIDKALELDDSEIVYLVEDDFLHLPQSENILLEGFELGSDYVSLYDHPDKYLNANMGGNPYIEDGGEVTRVLLSKSCHWKMTNSTVLTFATKVGTLREDSELWKETTIRSPHLGSFHAFIKLRDSGKTLISSIPGYATHGETRWMTPLVEWSKV